MSCNYFKLSLFSIVLCILIITHKFSHDHIFHNKRNTDDIINATPRILLAEPQETDIFKTQSGENSLTQPINTKLEENDTEHHKTSSDCTLDNEIQEKHDSQTEQVELENEKNNKLDLQKSHNKKIKKAGLLLLFIFPFPIETIIYIVYSTYRKNKKNKKNVDRDQVKVFEKNIDVINEN